MKRTLLSLIAVLAFSVGTFAQLWVTQGLGWTAQSRGVTYVHVTDAQTVWLTGYDGSGSGAYINEFSMTSDGGATWTPGSVLGGTTYGLGNICGISATTAWVAVYNGVAAQDNTCGVYKTTDGGATWVQQPGALQGSASFADNVYFWDENNGMCHGDVKDGYFEIYTTTNGGSTWTRVPQANITGSAVSGEGGWTGVIEAIGANKIMFGTNKSNIYISNDRGFHWFVKPTGLLTTGTNGGVNEISFVDENNGIAAHANTNSSFQISRTTDGGTTWNLVTYTGTCYSNDLSGIPGTSTYIATGAATDKSGLTYSFDNGNTWTEMLDVTGTQMLAQDWLNDSTGWVGTFNTTPDDGIQKFNGVFALPVANFVASDSAITLGGQITFTNLSTGKPTSQAWTFEGGSPSSSTLKNPPPITYNTPGDFTVSLRVTNGFGKDTLIKTDYIHVGGVGINDISNVNISVFPNPAHDFLKLSSSQTIQTIQVYNMVGQTVIDRKVDSKEYTVGVSDLNNGVYTMKLTINDKPYIRKIVVN